MSKPRIRIAISQFLPATGGAERQALLQARALRARGYDTSILTMRHEMSWPPHDEMEGVPVERVGGALVARRRRLPAPLRKLAYLAGLAAIGWRLWRERRGYDLIHAYQLNLLALPVGLAARLARKPLVIGVRCASPPSSRPSSQSADRTARAQPQASAMTARPPERRLEQPRLDQGEAAREWQRRVGDISDLAALLALGRPAVRFVRWLLRRDQVALVAVSTAAKRDLLDHHFDVARIEIIPNGVDLARFTLPAPRQAPRPGEQTVLCVARLSYEKGVDVLLQAWRIVHERYPRARLVVAGSGSMEAELRRLASELELGESVRFAGLQADVRPFLAAADVAVVASRLEGMPNALLEEMACGLACVATRVSGSEDIIVSGENGLLVEPGDAPALAEALLALLESPERARAYGQAARATIEADYSAERMIDRYEALYAVVEQAAK